MKKSDHHEAAGSALEQAAAWADQLVRRRRTLVAVDFGPRLIQRWQSGRGSAEWASKLARQFVSDTQPQPASDLVVSPYAPPQRQISAARQGAADWAHEPGRGVTGPPAQQNELPTILQDLIAQGWTGKKS
ncbi:MAG: hypothetical protein H0T53_10785 [Herpetosiphonaceae bacterium]|nr:hypothetical protein [Herpetosiphonaceae bacterium]